MNFFNRFVDSLQNILSGAITSQYIFTFIAISSTGYLLANTPVNINFLKYIFTMTAIIVQLLNSCWFGNSLTVNVICFYYFFSIYAKEWIFTKKNNIFIKFLNKWNSYKIVFKKIHSFTCHIQIVTERKYYWFFFSK